MFLIYLNGECRGSAVYLEDAAAFVSFLGDGTEVRASDGKKVLWTEGAEGFPAGDSFDSAADVMLKREAVRS